MAYVILNEEDLRDEVVELLDSIDGFRAFCPFHDEGQNPNLVIYPENVYCFSCGKHLLHSRLLATLDSRARHVDFDFALSAVMQRYAKSGDLMFQENIVRLVQETEYFENQLLAFSLSIRERRTAENFDEIEHELMLYDLDV